MAKRENTAGQIADGLAELQRLVTEDLNKTPEQARAAGYVPADEIVPDATIPQRIMYDRLMRLRKEGKVESIKVTEGGNIWNWWRVKK